VVLVVDNQLHIMSLLDRPAEVVVVRQQDQVLVDGTVLVLQAKDMLVDLVTQDSLQSVVVVVEQAVLVEIHCLAADLLHYLVLLVMAELELI
jgi:hypothetical protein